MLGIPTSNIEYYQTLEEERRHNHKLQRDLKRKTLSMERKRELVAKARDWNLKNKPQYILSQVKTRALKTGKEFNLTIEDIVIPSHCPVLGIPLNAENTYHAKDNSPSLDRVDNSKGYIKGNVLMVSFKANRLKSDATPDEILAVGNFYKNLKNNT